MGATNRRNMIMAEKKKRGTLNRTIFYVLPYRNSVTSLMLNSSILMLARMRSAFLSTA